MGGWNKRTRTTWPFACLLATVQACNDGPSFQTGNRFASEPSLNASPMQSETFDASIFQARQLAWDASKSSVTESQTLVKGQRQSLSLTQTERPLYVDSFAQGGDGAAMNQSFAVKEA